MEEVITTGAVWVRIWSAQISATERMGVATFLAVTLRNGIKFCGTRTHSKSEGFNPQFGDEPEHTGAIGCPAAHTLCCPNSMRILG